MPLNLSDPLVETAVFGRQVEDFLESPIGDYLVQCARNEIEQAARDLTIEMKKPGPVDPAVVERCQRRIQIAEAVRNWLGYAVEAGIVALEQIVEES
jgi:hypothetical protein